MPSAVLTDQVAGHALGEILKPGRVGKLPEVRPSLRPVSLDRISAGSDLQTRALFDPEEDAEDAALLESIRDVGVHQPVHLVGSGDRTYIIRSGHRRVSAARLAGLSEIPAIVWPEGTDAFDSALDTWLENLHRKDLAPLERGRMLAELLERFDLPRSPASARKLGLSKTSFYRYLALLSAPSDIRQALQRGEIGVMQAEKLASIKDPDVRSDHLRVATKGTAPSVADEDLGRQSDSSPEGKLPVTDPGVYSSAGLRRGTVRQDPSWASRKSLELSRALKLDIEDLAPITKALNARQMGAPAAASAALLVAAGEGAEEAISSVGSFDRRTLRALDALLRSVSVAAADQRNPENRLALHRILLLLASLLDGGDVGCTG
jgi:ParB/RepB/Spo0J family partition protein